jgi:diguanylate cyclase (GGDEF)-like protein/PAS domain S-box-containing protein
VSSSRRHVWRWTARWPGITLPTQAFLLTAISIVIVSVALIWHQGESIKERVLADRLAAVWRVGGVFESHVTTDQIGNDRAAIAQYLQGEIAHTMQRLGAIQAVVTDETGTIVASANNDEVGQLEGAEEVSLVLAGTVEYLMRPEKGEEDKDFAFTIPLVFPAFRGVLHVEEDIQGLYGAIAEASWSSGRSALLMSLLAALLAALAVRHVLRQTQRSELERASRDRSQALVQSASDAILVVDASGVVTYASPAVQPVLGHSQIDVLETSILDLVHPADREVARTMLAAVTEAPERPARNEWRLGHEDGHWVFAEVHAANLIGDSAVRGIVITVRDLSERKAFEAQLTYQALHDTVTGLASGALFNDRLRQAVARASRTGGGIAVLVIDLDDFGIVNDTHGHSAGDAVLAQVGQRLLACLRELDTAARLGGDEFAILLDDVTPEDIDPISARILAVFGDPFPIEGTAMTIKASIGLVEGDPLFVGMADLLTCASVARYVAKDSGKGRLTIYESGMRTAANERRDATAQLRTAIDEGQLEVVYQPIVAIPAGRLRSLEALVRWRHPVRGVVMPSEFIPLAEMTGLIVPLGEYVIHEACRQMRAWQLADLDAEPVTISVNVSTAQLESPGLVNVVREALQDSGLAPALLTLEITESVLALDPDLTTTRLRELKDVGVMLSIDDFGTGYSSLSYLRQFPVDFIKIDKSFVDGLGGRAPGLGLAKSIVRLAHNLRLLTIAEGVENDQQLARLIAIGCDEAQGYLFSRPLAVTAATEYLRNEVKPAPLPAEKALSRHIDVAGAIPRQAVPE